MENRRIAAQLHGSLHGEAWHGPALLELLMDVTADQAAAYPIAGAHSIREVVLHVIAWQDVARRRIQGEAVRLSREQDWPAPGAAESWEELKGRLERGGDELEQAIAALPDDRLEEKAAGEQYSVYFLLHGVVQHNLYHAGQIALLRKV